MGDLKSFLAIAGQIIAASGAVGLAVYAAFKLLATKWLENKFSERLEAFKHRQNQELEELRFKIDGLLDRTVKLHQREFEVLPDTWGLCEEAFRTARASSMGLQQYADLDRMPLNRFNAWLENADLQKWQKDELTAETDKNKYYSRTLAWRQIKQAEECRWKFQSYLQKNGIFMPREMKDQFQALLNLIIGANVEREINLDDRAQGSPRLFDASKALCGEGLAKFEVLEKSVHERLWNSTKA